VSQIKMISDEESERILNKNKEKFTKEQVRIIKQILIELANIEVEQFKLKDHYENSSNHEPCVNGRTSQNRV
jgi:hypothetical protein